MKIIQDDIKNNTNISGLEDTNSPTNEYIIKYMEWNTQGKLSENELEVVGMISNAIALRSANFNETLKQIYMLQKGMDDFTNLENVYFEELDEQCLNLLKEVYSIK